jgi:hypothetical protein
MLYDSRTIDPFGTLGLFPLHVRHRRRKGFNFYLSRDLQCVELMSRNKVVAHMSHCRPWGENETKVSDLLVD